VTTSRTKIKIKWLQLIRTTGIGPIRFWQLLDQFGDIDLALETLKTHFSYAKAESEWQAHERKGYHLVAAFEKEYPEKLKRLRDHPPLLSVVGSLDSLQKPALAIVGARNASLGGRKLSFYFGQDVGKSGWAVVSGLARGIDEAAHRGALKTGTLAVLAGGADCIYPPEHESLYKEIVQTGGAIVSEMPLGMAPSAPLFPRRNRLIAALSQGVIIVEAAKGSGSLITADYALDLGIDVFAVPGSPLDPRCHGSNYLLKQGAILTESAADILAVAGTLNTADEKRPEAYVPVKKSNPLDIRKQILEDLTTVPTPIETLLESYDYPANQLLSLLSELELNGQVIRHPGNRFSLK